MDIDIDPVIGDIVYARNRNDDSKKSCVYDRSPKKGKKIKRFQL